MTEERLVKARKVPEAPTSTSLFFAGFLPIFLLYTFRYDGSQNAEVGRYYGDSTEQDRW